MYTLLKPLLVREKLLEKGITMFTPLEFGRIFNLPDYKTKYFLEKWTNETFLTRLKKGLYALKADLPREEEIANRLYKPSYISFEYALAYYNILPEMPYSITSATTKPTRTFTADDKTFTFLKIKRNAYTGYVLIKNGRKSFLIAMPEKALVDYLYFVAIGKKTLNDRLNIAHLHKEKLLEYAKSYSRAKLFTLIKKLK